MLPATTTESFWDFSVRTYRSDGVPEACLSLQDDYAVDVNMLLYCCWCGERVGPFDDALFDAAVEFSESWFENVVVKLRDARRWMKHDGCHTAPIEQKSCLQLREKIKQVEFAAEKIQEEALEALLSSRPSTETVVDDVVAGAASNLARYFDHIGQTVSDDVRTKLAVIVCAAFPDAESEVVATALRT